MSKTVKMVCVTVVMFAALMVSTAANAQWNEMPMKLGLGYQGIMTPEFLNHASLRVLPQPLGGQLMIGYWDGDIDDFDGKLYSIRGKVLYSLVDKELVRFCVGGELGYAELDLDDMGKTDNLTYGVLFGAEWQFEEIPEIGFNFEVGYQFNDIKNREADVKMDLDGINVTLGIHYYF